MNQLLLLGGLVLVIYIMNEKNMFKSMSLGKDSTVLIAVFCGIILFMFMRKKVEGLISSSSVENSGGCESIGMREHRLQVVDENNEGAFNTVMVCVTPHGEGILTQNGELLDNSDPEMAQGLKTPDTESPEQPEQPEQPETPEQPEKSEQPEPPATGNTTQ